MRQRELSHLALRTLPLGDVLGYVCQTVGLKWRVDKHAILIANELPPIEETVTRYFNVRPGFIQAILASANAAGGSSGGGDAFGDDDDYSDYGDDTGGGESVSASPDTLKAGFQTLGVPF